MLKVNRRIVFFLSPLFIFSVIGVYRVIDHRADLLSESSADFREQGFWFLLYRVSNREMLYFGESGNVKNSTLIKTFQVKTGIVGQRPTPLPQLVGREYWKLVGKQETFDSLETAPYFLMLDVPVSEDAPYGPVPYLECSGQCNWDIPGAFGLHGVAGDEGRLSILDPGSSGCIRHLDVDITYLYNLLNPEYDEIRYYIQDI